ncbi:C-GCAxxG-C-C family (seleno)protein [Desulfurobacterium sp.]
MFEIKDILKNIKKYRDLLGERALNRVEDLQELGKVAYKGYWERDCEYGIIRAFVETAGLDISFDEVIENKMKIPVKWHSICGALTGAFVVFAVSLPEDEIESAVEELVEFHNNSVLPIFSGNGSLIPGASPDSVLCRDSIVNWARKTGISPRSAERRERCARITADIAIKAAEIINKKVAVSQVAG